MSDSHAELTMLAIAVMQDVEKYSREHHLEFEAFDQEV